MPMYEYHCKECGADIEILHRTHNEPIPVCPKCNKDALEKKMSHSNFKLVGSGWYATDYAHGSSCGCSGCSHKD